MDWEVGEIFYSQQDRPRERTADDAGITNTSAKERFRAFLHDFHEEHGVFTYRDQLIRRYRRKDPQLEVKMADLTAADSTLASAFRDTPTRLLPLFETAIREALGIALGYEPGEEAADARADLSSLPHFQLVIRWDHPSDEDRGLTQIRQITASEVNRLLVVPGIIINASRSRPQATGLQIRCRNCNHTQMLPITNPFAPVSLPRTCEANLLAQAVPGNPAADERACPIDPYVVEPDRSTYVDQQTLKLQEAPEDVPTGEMPRHIMLSVNRQLVDLVKPGTRVRIVGVSSVFTPKSRGSTAMSVRRSFLKVVGIHIMSQGAAGGAVALSSEEKEEIDRMARDRDVYTHIWQSVAPSVSGGYTEDIKKAIACLLVGGSRRVLPDGMRLRGDINVLLLGDPSTAKSQFLKFVEKVAPVGVYTSGKGSSAAGLTASVTRDSRGEFYLEGGAMVLADGGVVCIDEFDKMREEDRVAIHEAMEQQTISVAKAGITTILNARSAVLAAANPTFGRYDDRQSPAENIDFLPTILSRFDLIFIVRDIRDRERDIAIANHVMSLHFAENRLTEATTGINIDLLKKYISYCRQQCAPCLTQEASTQLAQEYVKIREGQRKHSRDVKKSTIPITVRQLEAIVRVSEALAKMQLSADVTIEHVKEAVRLFKSSTLSAARAGHNMEGMVSEEQQQEVQTVENWIRRRVPIGNKTSTRALVDEEGHSEPVVRKAIEVMVRRGEFKYQQGVRKLVRVR